MRRSGRRSPTDGRCGNQGRDGRRLGPPAALLLTALAVLAAVPAAALDFFTLWQRPELPLSLEAGQWADYRRQAVTEGRRTDDLVRIQCLGRDGQGRWLLEVLPLVETGGGDLEPAPGEGLRLRLTGDVTDRAANVMDAVDEVRLWRDGAVQVLDRRQWRRDPLVTASFSGDFAPDTVEETGATIRVIAGRELTCRQLVFAAADTQVAELPGTRMIQTASQEVTAAVSGQIPLLGLAYVSERVAAESRLDPPSKRMPAPPPSLRVEILECLDFGGGAAPGLPADAGD
jgi:hypothetical protein